MQKLPKSRRRSFAEAPLLAVAALCLSSLVASGASAHEPYSEWRVPQTGTSCCSGLDCGPAQASYENGKWWVNILGQWLEVPEDRILYDTPNPDGNAHVCYNGRVLCFMRPEARS
jgi:hypothetical protein